jgi:transposase InsO family protein
VKYAGIAAEKAKYPVSWMCRKLGVSTSGYYAWLSHKPSARATANELLLTQIRDLRRGHAKNYGSPRVYRALRAQGHKIGRHRVARLMHAHGLFARQKRRWVKTTDSQHHLPIAPNLLARDFKAPAPNTRWVGDISYIPTDEGWLFLAVVLDLFARRVVGWNMDDNMRTPLVTGALTMAIEQRGIAPGVLFHSDRGSQYASHEFQKEMATRGMVGSMSRRGECWDNAAMESFFGTLKQELVHQVRFRTRQEAKSAIFEYIEVFYNRQRLHSTLDYLSPVEYEDVHANTTLAA